MKDALFLIVFIQYSSAFNQITQDFLSSFPDSVKIADDKSVEKNESPGWFKENMTLVVALIAASAAIIAAIITGIFTLMAKNKELKQRISQAEEEKQAAVEET